MKTKNPLERKRPLFFTAGLLFAVSLALVSFEWRTPYQVPKIPILQGEEPETVWIPVTIPDAEEPKEKPKVPEKKVVFAEVNPVDEVKESADAKEPELFSKDDLPKFDGPANLPDEGDADDPPEIPKVWERTAFMPEYCGGEKAMFDFLGKELKYPEIPRINGVTGKVYVRFVVGKNGKVRDAEIIRSVDPWLDAEALRVAKKLTCFTPGRQAGRNVDVYFVLPINFVLK